MKSLKETFVKLKNDDEYTAACFDKILRVTLPAILVALVFCLIYFRDDPHEYVILSLSVEYHQNKYYPDEGRSFDKDKNCIAVYDEYYRGYFYVADIKEIGDDTNAAPVHCRISSYADWQKLSVGDHIQAHRLSGFGTGVDGYIAGFKKLPE